MELRPHECRPRSATPVERFVEHSERFRLYAHCPWLIKNFIDEEGEFL